MKMFAALRANPLMALAVMFLIVTIGFFGAAVFYANEKNVYLTGMCATITTVALGVTFAVAFRADKKYL